MKHSSTKVAVIIPNWNGGPWLPDCLKGLFEQDFSGFSVIVVDNGSSDDSLPFIKSHFPQIQLICFKENLGFSAAVNAGIQASQSKYVVLLNTDTCPKSDWLSNLVKVMDSSSETIGCLASKMLDMSNPNLIENAGDILSWQGAATKRGRGQMASEFNDTIEIFSACAGAALYRKSFLDELGGFDEHFFAYLEDVDLGFRGRHLGYQYLFVPSAEIFHKGHGTSIPSSRYVRLITRNRLLLLLKNMPFSLLLKRLSSIIYGQLYFFLVYKKPLHSLLGYLSFIILIPHILKERKKILRKSKLSMEKLELLITHNMGEPPLRQLLLKWIKGFSS